MDCNEKIKTIIGVIGPNRFLDEMIRAQSIDELNSNLDWIARCYDIDLSD